MKQQILFVVNLLHRINDVGLPVFGYTFLLSGMAFWVKDLMYLGLTMLGVYWVSQIASWLGYLNKRIDKYYAPEYEEYLNSSMKKNKK